jgi:proteasome lid subunit RPN8/RPN11
MIRIPKQIVDEMTEHAKICYPNEACGILAQNTTTVFFPMKNTDEASVSYFMDPKEQLLVFKKMRQSGSEMKGIFHSHVASEAYPSQKDVRLAFYPEVSYLIVSLSDIQKPVLRSFRILDEKVTEEKIEIIK